MPLRSMAPPSQMWRYFFFNKYLINMIIRNFHTNDIIQDCSVYRDLSVFNRYDSNLQLIRTNNLFIL